MAADEIREGEGEAEPAAAADAPAEPVGRQLRFEGMPVSRVTLGVSGTLTASASLSKKLKLGSEQTLTVRVLVSSKKNKAPSAGGEPTGELDQHIVLQLVDLELPDEASA